MTVLASRTGRPIDLVEPLVQQVDFSELAWSLAHCNRHAGNGQLQVSVGQHALIGLDLAPEALRPFWLLRDAPMSRLGPMPAEALEALLAVAAHLGGQRQASVVRAAYADLWLRHARTLHDAARLPLPDDEQTAQLQRIADTVEATERRDFHAPELLPRPRHRFAEAARRAVRFMAPDKVADALDAQFRRHLPALRPAAVSISAVGTAGRRRRA